MLYEKIAEEISYRLGVMKERGTDTIELVFFTHQLADMFEKDNPNFDRLLFINSALR